MTLTADSTVPFAPSDVTSPASVSAEGEERDDEEEEEDQETARRADSYAALVDTLRKRVSGRAGSVVWVTAVVD